MQLLIPYALVNDPACARIAATLQLPRLEQLLRRLSPGEPVQGTGDSLSPPHEHMRARALGLACDDGRMPWAALGIAQAGRDPGQDAWGWITPAHWEVGSHGIRMLDPATLELPEPQARALLEAMAPYFRQDGIGLSYHRPGRWLAVGEPLAHLPCASLERVAGHDVAAWMPASGWLRRLQTEMQMLLYTHPVNDERSAAGQLPVNAFWVSGAGALPAGWTPAAEPLMADALCLPALQGQWDHWAAAWQRIDQQHCGPLLAELDVGRAASLVLCSERNAVRFDLQPRRWQERLRRRWQAVGLAQLGSWL